MERIGIYLLLQILITPLLSPLVLGWIRKWKALFQNRQGASVWQPYRDLWKLFHKDEVISETASWIFRFAPYLVFTTTLILGAAIPMFLGLAYPLGDFIVFVYILALGTFFLALASLDTASPFGGFAASREMTMSALTEGGLLFSFLAVAFATSSTNFLEMTERISYLSVTGIVSLLIAFIAFYIALLSETARYPFDNPATHLELTMIHEALIIEYSGKRLALMDWATANKLLIFLSLGATIFFPWGAATIVNATTFVSILVLFITFIAKIFLLAFSIAFIESVIAKLRYFRLPDLLLTSFMLATTAIIISVFA